MFEEKIRERNPSLTDTHKCSTYHNFCSNGIRTYILVGLHTILILDHFHMLICFVTRFRKKLATNKGHEILDISKTTYYTRKMIAYLRLAHKYTKTAKFIKLDHEFKFWKTGFFVK